MKRLLLLLPLVLFALFSCSKEEEAPTPPPTPTYKLSFSAEEGGTVSTEGGIYNQGSKITVTATPDGQYLFKEWSDGSTVNPREITVNADLTLKATFVKKTYPLSVTIDGEGTVQEQVIIQGSTTETEYNAGTTVRLTATANEGWMFEGWSGDVESEELEIEVPIEKGMAITALFEVDTYSVSIKIIGPGKVNNSTEDFSIEGDPDKPLVFIAEPTNDWNMFLTWDGDINKTTGAIEIYPDSDLEIRAIFLSKEELSGVSVTGEGELMFSNFELDPQNDEKLISFEAKALPSDGYIFRGWNGISTLFYGGVEITKNPIRVNLESRQQNSPLESFFVPNDGNYEEIKTLYELINHPSNGDLLEIYEAVGGAAAGGAYYENETGKYVFFAPKYLGYVAPSKLGIPRRGAVIYKYEEDGWRFFKLDRNITGWSGRNTEVIDNKYIVTGDGNEIGDDGNWSGDLFYGEIIGQEINWIRVTNDQQMTYFHGTTGGDLNGDGLIDVGGTGGSGYRIYVQTSPGVFTLSNDLLDIPFGNWDGLVGGIPFAWDFGDIDNDGIDEIIMADYGGEMSDKANNISIWKFNSSSSKFELSFLETIPLSIFSIKRGATKVSTEDIDNDGFKDVIVAGEGDRNTLEVWRNKGDNTFELTWFSGWDPIEMGVREFFIADANNDGYLDILPLTHNIGSRIILEGGFPFAKRLFNPQILVNQRDGTFKEYNGKTIIDRYSSFGGFSIPYTNNGLLEIMSINASTNKIYPERNEIYLKSEVITIDLNE